MILDDLLDAQALQRDAYAPFLLEDARAFSSRITHESSYCLIAICGKKLVAYLLAHGWRPKSPPRLGEMLSPTGEAEVLFIHDLAVAPPARGSGVGRRLIAQVLASAARDGLRSAELIAVSGAAPYWKKLGFTQVQVSPELRAKIALYGVDACLMERPLDQDDIDGV